jgi:hypothetical protein
MGARCVAEGASEDVDERAGRRPAALVCHPGHLFFFGQQDRRRNEIERTINQLRNSRAVATRYAKRAYIFHGTVTAAAIRLWLRP